MKEMKNLIKLRTILSAVKFLKVCCWILWNTTLCLLLRFQQI
jgi:hypothetical protein